MKNILFVNACVRPESRTRRLAEAVLAQMEGNVTEVNLEREAIRPLDKAGLAERDVCSRAGDFEAPIFRYARQFAGADEIVIAAPYWDLMFPAMVRAYLEAVTVPGVTFYYTEKGIPKGLCRAKRLTYVTTAGGPIGTMNFGYDYVKALCGAFYGIPQTECVKAEHLDIIGNDAEAILSCAIANVRERNWK